MRSGVLGGVAPRNDEGAAPVSPPPASVSVGAQPPPASVSNSACMSYTAALAGLQDKTSVPDLDFAHFWHFGCGAKPLKMLVSMGWHKTFLHVQALDLGPSNG